MAKIILRGIEARKKLLKGINEVYNAVRVTLGPSGRNALMERHTGVLAPLITNDGVSIAQEIILKDEAENIGAQTIIEAARKTNSQVGDGTTTSIILAQKILSSCIAKIDDETSLIDNKTDVMEIMREIDKQKKLAVEELKKLAKPIKTQKELEKVAIASSENEELGKIVAEMQWKLGKTGFIHTEETQLDEISYNYGEGMNFFSKFASSYFADDYAELKTIKKNVPVLITNIRLENVGQIFELTKELAKRGEKNLVIMSSGGYNRMMIDTFVANKLKGTFNICALSVPSQTEDELDDIALFTNAKFIDKYKQYKLENIKVEDLGKIIEMISKDRETFLSGGSPDVKKRVEDLKKQAKNQEVEALRNRTYQRIASLTTGIGKIKVGSRNDLRRTYLKRKTDDAVCAVKAALEEGIIDGAGQSFIKIAKKLPQNILTEVLKAPYEQLRENSGGEGGKTIDPLKVMRVALENACEVAGTILTTETIIVNERQGIDKLHCLIEEYMPQIIKLLKKK